MEKLEVMPVGVIVQKRRIGHPWKEWTWEPVGVIPWAREDASWAPVLTEPDRVQYHAATLHLELHRSDTEAYVANLETGAPGIYVVLREAEPEDQAESAVGAEVVPHLVTLSPYEAQDYLDSGEETVERLTLPPALLAWLEAFVATHHQDEKFVKRRRDKVRVDRVEDGKGDPRIRQPADVFRAPGATKTTVH